MEILVRMNELLRTMEFLKPSSRRVVIVETDDGNLKKMAETGIDTTSIRRTIVETLRRLRNESGSSFLIIDRVPLDWDIRYLNELTEEVWKYGQSIVFVGSWGDWDLWKKHLNSHGLVGLLDVSMRFKVSS